MQRIAPAQQVGFTLIEMMIVVAILSILATIAVPTYISYLDSAKEGECYTEVSAIRLAEEEVFLNAGQYFSGNGVTELETNSQNIYQASSRAKSEDKRRCTYKVEACKDGSNNDRPFSECYKVIATGDNGLSGVIISEEGP